MKINHNLIFTGVPRIARTAVPSTHARIVGGRLVRSLNAAELQAGAVLAAERVAAVMRKRQTKLASRP